MRIGAHLLYQATHGAEAPAGEHLCFVCGEHGDGRPLALPDQFADLWRCDRRGSLMCAACEHAFAPPGYRRYGHALITASSLTPLSRSDIDAILFEQPWPSEQWALAISLSRKKNVIPWAPVNAAHTGAAVQMETETVQVDRTQLGPVRAAFRALAADFSKLQIVQDRYTHLALYVRKGGSITAWQERRAVLRQWLGSNELELISYLTVREDTHGDDAADAGATGSD